MLLSYAQNFEDVILWRALKHVQHGTYIDIGACDPVTDSVSHAFYSKGWRGVHVEPVPALADRLRAARPDEEVIQAVITNGRRSDAFYVIGETGLSTGDKVNAEHHQRKGYVAQDIVAPCLPLHEVLNGLGDRDIHWLKIDVEGMEGEVIASWEPSPVRPWVVVVEVLSPVDKDVHHLEWEPELLKLGYEYAYFDGLNRFYVSEAHLELKARFGPGPNIFDDFVLTEHSTAPFCQKLKYDLHSAGLQVATLTDQLQAQALSRAAENEEHRKAIASLALAHLVTRRSLRTCQKELKAWPRRLRRDQKRYAGLEKAHAELADKYEAARADVERIQSRADALWTVADKLTNEIEALRRSRSWRATAALRMISSHMNNPAPMLASGLKAARRLLQFARRQFPAWLVHFIYRRPLLKKCMVAVLGWVPGLHQRAVQMLILHNASHVEGALPIAVAVPSPPAITDSTLSSMPASARRVYRRLSVLRAISR